MSPDVASPPERPEASAPEAGLALRPNPRAWRSALGAAAFALASAALLLFQLGYSFETGDQLQYLLLPYRQLYPDFLPGDWFTWHTSHYHQSFAVVVRALHALSGERRFAAAVFALHTLNLAAVGLGLWRLARALRCGWPAALFALLIFGGVRQVGLAGALLNHAGLVPADLALAPFLCACAALLERRRLALGAWLGLAGLMHANYAVLGPLALLPIELAFTLRARARVNSAPRERGLAPLFGAALLFTLIAAPTLGVVLGSFIARDSSPAAVAVILFVRSPHHYDLRSMRGDEFVFAALLVLTSGDELRRRARYAELPAPTLPLLASFAGWLALGLLGSGLHLVSLARLFTFRLSIPLFALLLLATGAALMRAAREGDWLRLLWLLAGCGMMLTFAQNDPLEPSAWNEAPLAAAGALASYGLAGLALNAIASADGRLFRSVRRAVALLGAALSVGIALNVALRPVWNGHSLVRWPGLHLFDRAIAIEPRVRGLYARIRTGTPSDARFLIPPGLMGFRLQARRAAFVDWKCAPMKGDEALEWQRRMLLVMGTADFPARGYELPRTADALYFTRPVADLAALARSEHLSHLLVRKSNLTAGSHGLKRLFAVGTYMVFEVLP